MVTLVGTQSDFNVALEELVELEYDVISAYKLAIEKLENTIYKTKLKGFLADHERHIAEIKHTYFDELVLPGSGDFLKSNLAKLKVVIANALGSDKNILKAMLTNEIDTNTAYERMTNHPDEPVSQAIILVLKQAYEDEKRHRSWLEAQINETNY